MCIKTVAMKRKILAGNWKMNTTLREGLALVDGILAGVEGLPGEVELIVCPPYTHLAVVGERLLARVAMGAQDCAMHGPGAYTGDIAAAMLSGLGCRHVIVGHSERRTFHGEQSEQLLAKLRQALAVGLNPIYCCGEPEAMRDGGETAAWAYVRTQLELLKELEAESFARLMVAYEPIWAIGTGKTATPEMANWMCERIDEWLQANLGVGQYAIPVLYGGSCKPSNARELFAQPGISGGLIGGASLKAEDFLALGKCFPVGGQHA